MISNSFHGTIRIRALTKIQHTEFFSFQQNETIFDSLRKTRVFNRTGLDPYQQLHDIDFFNQETRIGSLQRILKAIFFINLTKLRGAYKNRLFFIKRIELDRSQQF